MWDHSLVQHMARGRQADAQHLHAERVAAVKSLDHQLARRVGSGSVQTESSLTNCPHGDTASGATRPDPHIRPMHCGRQRSGRLQRHCEPLFTVAALRLLLKLSLSPLHLRLTSDRGKIRQVIGLARDQPVLQFHCKSRASIAMTPCDGCVDRNAQPERPQREHRAFSAFIRRLPPKHRPHGGG